jgi:hypothetical protein
VLAFLFLRIVATNARRSEPRGGAASVAHGLLAPPSMWSELIVAEAIGFLARASSSSATRPQSGRSKALARSCRDGLFFGP